MSLSDLKVEQLDMFLANLTPAAAGELLRAIEADGPNGGGLDPNGLIASRLKALMDPLPEMSADLKELLLREFSNPFEDLLTDRPSSDKQRGRIARNSIEQVWTWLTRDLMPEKLPKLAADIKSARDAEDEAGAREKSGVMYGLVADTLAGVFSKLQPNTMAYMRLAGHVGGNAVLEDAREMMMACSLADHIMSFRAGLPDAIRDVQAEDGAAYIQAYKEFDNKTGGYGWLGLLSLLRRFEKPADIVWLTARIVGSNADSDLRADPAGLACECLMHDMEFAAERAIGLIRAQRDIDQVLAEIRQFHEIADELSGELDLDLKGTWGNYLVTVRKLLARHIRNEIGDCPRRVKVAIYCDYRRPLDVDGKPVALTEGPDRNDLKSAEFGVRLLLGIKPYLDQLPLNAEYAALNDEILQFVERIADMTIERLRIAEPAEKPAIEEYLQANILFTGIVFGEDASNLLRRQGRVAARQESDSQAIA